MEQTHTPLISTHRLANMLDDKNLRIIDASWYLPSAKRNAEQEYQDRHISGAIYFNLDEIADKNSSLTHMIASESEFSKIIGNMGISEDNFIVIYDVEGLFSAPRVWWNFRIMGAKKTYILDGGLKKWIKDGYELSDKKINYPLTNFTAQLKKECVYSANDILSLIKANFPNGEQIIDMRPSARFLGQEDEPREGLERGHIPNSINLPFSELVDNGRLKKAQTLKKIIKEKNIDLSKPIITSCGSGVSAAIFNFALANIGVDCLNLYDGSWAEWGCGDKYPISNPNSL